MSQTSSRTMWMCLVYVSFASWIAKWNLAFTRIVQTSIKAWQTTQPCSLLSLTRTETYTACTKHTGTNLIPTPNANPNLYWSLFDRQIWNWASVRKNSWNWTWIQITTTANTRTYLFWKFHENSTSSFRVFLLTESQTLQKTRPLRWRNR